MFERFIQINYDYYLFIRPLLTMNYHDQTNQQLNQPYWNGANQGIMETQMGSLQGTNPYLINNPNGGIKSNQQLMGAGMNNMGNPMMNMNQIPGTAIFPGMVGPQMAADPRRFIYAGDQVTFKVRLDGVSEAQLQNINEAVVYGIGKPTSQLNVLGLTCTILWGAFLILPLILMCFDCWKRCIYPNFELSEQFYNSLSRLTQSNNLQSLVLLVNDNAFGVKKAKILHQILSNQPSLIGFTFINYAMGYNYNQSQYGDFVDNMMPIKKLPIMSDLRWYRNIVIP